MTAKAKGRGIIFVILVLASSPAFAAKGIHLGGAVGLGDLSLSGRDFQGYNANTGSVGEFDFGYGITENIYVGLYSSVIAGTWTPGTYSSQYSGVLGKYSFSKKGAKYFPYLELGLHNATFFADVPEGVFFSDVGLGAMAGGGVEWFVGKRKRVLMAGDLSYRTANFSSGRIEPPGGGVLYTTQYVSGLDATANAVFLLFKIGYVWRPGM